MSHFFKTELGQTALQQRHIPLTARQRRLLLLIDHENFEELEHGYKERIAPTELVEQLIKMGLLAKQSSSSKQENVRVETKTYIPPTPLNDSIPVAANGLKTAPQVDAMPLEKLPFVEIQQVMIQTLTSYCGLLARPLIQKIQTIKTLAELKMCQMQWITLLQESRIPPVQLNQTLKLINYSVQHL